MGFVGTLILLRALLDIASHLPTSGEVRCLIGLLVSLLTARICREGLGRDLLYVRHRTATFNFCVGQSHATMLIDMSQHYDRSCLCVSTMRRT